MPEMNRRQFLKGTLAGIGAAVMASFMPLVPSPEVGSAILQINPGNKLLSLRKGDIITLQGVYAINPVTKKPTEYLQQFVVTDDVIGALEEFGMFLPSQLWGENA